MEWRKHYDQMTPEERQIVRQLILKNPKYYFTQYSYDKRDERGIINPEVYKCIKYGYIIEFHYINGKKRVLLRSKPSIHSKDNVCVVVDIDTCEIITTYKNEKTDFHITLNKNLYDNDYNLLNYIQ